jgi:hypothetical protein
MKKNSLLNLLIILLLAGLAFLLVQVLGGDGTAQLSGGLTGNPVDSVLDGLLSGLNSFTDSIGNLFGGLKP